MTSASLARAGVEAAGAAGGENSSSFIASLEHDGVATGGDGSSSSSREKERGLRIRVRAAAATASGASAAINCGHGRASPGVRAWGGVERAIHAQVNPNVLATTLSGRRARRHMISLPSIFGRRLNS